MRRRQGAPGGNEQAASGAIEQLHTAWAMKPAPDARAHRGVARHGAEADGQPGQRQDRELGQLRGACRDAKDGADVRHEACCILMRHFLPAGILLSSLAMGGVPFEYRSRAFFLNGGTPPCRCDHVVNVLHRGFR